MTATSDPQFPDHGQPSTWARLDEEELRCLEGLQKYYQLIENKDVTIAQELAWIDLKKEFARLEDFPWFI